MLVSPRVVHLTVINFSDLKRCVAVLCVNAITCFVSVRTVVHIRATGIIVLL